MSKTDELRAMREAKYARSAAARGATRATPSPTTPAAKAPVAPPAAKAAKAAAALAAAPDTGADTGAAADEALCGHRNMGGRTCTREQGHAAKSHRYS
ncbi:hypothetical protein FE634_09260 [Nocardioides dongxiaopingii]|uniref:hypothetical protein n=1 Tax=Nocardioides sp. S-1144 TaxID=2582905 RepID=UPI00110EEEE7|nr:hypothetical protein [Nocardioides sp. S-1144]QCW50553.1 hypothetical protein FE634_09260 [Nocardioides sp. S-1144]